MSEPLTSHEIEDVLSSIRRLVSEELRPAAPARVQPVDVPAPVVRADAQPAADPAQAEGDAGKLLLTPSLRVVSDLAEAAPVAEVQPLSLAEEVLAGHHGDDAVWAAAGEAEDGADSLEAVSGPDLEETVLAFTSAAADAPVEEIIAPAGDAPAAAEAVVAAPIAEWSAGSLPRMDWMQVEEPWVEEEEPVPFTSQFRRSRLEDEPLARAWADRAEADVRASLAEAPGEDSPDAPEVFVAEAPPQAAPSRIIRAEEFHPQDDEDEAEEPAHLFAAADSAGEAVIDEEVLRDIVREILREELAGQLGERITRNVRKLVRVEVNRALTARDFG